MLLITTDGQTTVACLLATAAVVTFYLLQIVPKLKSKRGLGKKIQPKKVEISNFSRLA